MQTEIDRNPKATVLLLGARSDVARATARRYAAAGYGILLAARDPERLQAEKTDLELRYRVPVTLLAFDALRIEDHAAFVAALPALPDVAISAIGLLGRQEADEADIPAAITVMRSNYEGPASILSHLANAFAARGSGTIIGISSVAGDRGRATNYIYGSAKAGFTAFLSGLRNRLAGRGVHVITVSPGFIATRMTAGMDLPEKLTASPDEVAEAIFKAQEKRRNVIYVRPIWRLIMLVIRSIPEPVFKRLKI
ncbi:SDR family oxidoreductase [Paragemmobacter kunshanensis]|uniref:SDR family oxidoreductase n=1 Tax=Paragemmobacter kunshanensis TaxID=2583234 RepID=UPI0031B6855B